MHLHRVGFHWLRDTPPANFFELVAQAASAFDRLQVSRRAATLVVSKGSHVPDTSTSIVEASRAE
eukprot:698754-Amphidinium_carterae.1